MIRGLCVTSRSSTGCNRLQEKLHFRSSLLTLCAYSLLAWLDKNEIYWKQNIFIAQKHPQQCCLDKLRNGKWDKSTTDAFIISCPNCKELLGSNIC